MNDDDLGEEGEIRVKAVNGNVVLSIGERNNPDSEDAQFTIGPELAYDLARTLTITAMEAETQ